jgi:hypothetical protein
MADHFPSYLPPSEEALSLEDLAQAALGSEPQHPAGAPSPQLAKEPPQAAAHETKASACLSLAASPAPAPAAEGFDDSQTPGFLLPLPAAAEPPPQQQAQGQQHATAPLAQAYFAECQALQTQPHPGTVEAFNTTPNSLLTACQPDVVPRANAGAKRIDARCTTELHCAVVCPLEQHCMCFVLKGACRTADQPACSAKGYLPASNLVPCTLPFHETIAHECAATCGNADIV